MIMYLTRIDAYAFVTGCGGYSGIYNVIFGIAHIIGKIYSYTVIEETCIQSYFICA